MMSTLLLRSLTRCHKGIIPRTNFNLMPLLGIHHFHRTLSSSSSSSNEAPTAASKPQQITPEEAQSKAKQILELFPGDTLTKKATYATITGGLAAFLVANGIYIPNDETLILVAFIFVTRFLYVKLGTPVANLIDSSIKEMREKLASARIAEVKDMGLEINELEQLSDYAAANESLFQTRAESVVLEAELSELLERNNFLTSVKGKLDDAVRKTTEKRIAERKQLVESIMAGVLKELKDPNTQNRLMKKCIADLKGMKPNIANNSQQTTA